MAIEEFDPKHCVWKQLDHRALYFNCVFARHVRSSGSSFVIKTVCSKCAEGIRSAVRTVQPSSSNRTSAAPILIIGTIANVIPAFSLGPLLAFAVVWDLRLFVQLAPDTMTDEFAHDREA